MLRLDDSWVWDYWIAEDDEGFHAFFLKAPRVLGDPDLRHWHARIGHAFSTDLVTWTPLPDALGAGPPGTFDDMATWTGSIVRDVDGTWRMFSSGVSTVGEGRVQRIGSARSRDLMTWERDPFVLAPDPRWYEVEPGADWHEEAWRDPWVFADPAAGGWRMLITARSRTGDPAQRGVVGTAVSTDLETWRVEPPLSQPDSGFGQIEVAQTYDVDGRAVLIFSCLRGELGGARAGRAGGIWAVNAPSLSGPFRVEDAYRVTDESLYVGRLVRRRDGSWALMAFRNTAPDGSFVGELADPIPVTIDRGRLALADPDHPAFPPERRSPRAAR